MALRVQSLLSKNSSIVCLFAFFNFFLDSCKIFSPFKQKFYRLDNFYKSLTHSLFCKKKQLQQSVTSSAVDNSTGRIRKKINGKNFSILKLKPAALFY